MVKKRKKLTLGTLINNSYVISNMRKEYYKLFHSLFSADELDIRNDIMHANNKNIDYHSLGITSVMMQFLWDIMKNEIFK